MNKTYDKYMIDCPNMDSGKETIEGILGIKFVAHESSYLGEYFRFEVKNAEIIILGRNFDELENEWNEPEFKNMRCYLEVNETENPDLIKAKLESNRQIKWIRREVI